MPDVTEDLVEGSLQEGPDGLTGSRVFQVRNLEGASNLWHKTALQYPGVPVRGDPYPGETDVLCLQKRVRGVHERTATVVCEYAVPTLETYPELGGQRTFVDSTVLEEESYFDINGVRMSVTYGTNPIITQYPSATSVQSMVTLTCVKYEQVTGTIQQAESDIAQRALDFVEHVNDVVWFGWPEKTWKVDDIQSRPAFNNQWLEVSHVLTYKPSTWRFLAKYIEAGRVPPDASEGDGFQRFDVRELADFTQLPIAVPTAPP